MREDFHKSILKSLSEAVCAVDLEWRIVCFNHQAQELTGMRSGEALGGHLRAVFPPEGSNLSKYVEDALRSGQSIRKKPLELMNCHGEQIPVIVNVSPVNNAGAVSGATIVIQDNRPIELLRRELRSRHTFGDIVSQDARIQQIMDVVPNVAASNSTVLIGGPTGTGKELLAKAIHNASSRCDGPFVAINTGALPDTLLESELFGYKKGAFTDAKEDKPGRIAQAEGGTLLLDEIGDVSSAMQVKLLRFLEEREYQPLGGTESIRADVRVLAATNQNLQERVEANTFRADLYYRLNVIEFRMPPLSDRPGDIPVLLEHFLKIFNAEKGRSIKRVTNSAMNYLMRYPYPGNVRELRNIAEHAYVLCPGEDMNVDCLPPRVLQAVPLREACHASEMNGVGLPLRRRSEPEQARMIREALRKHENHRANTARALGIDPSTLWRKMRKFHVKS